MAEQTAELEPLPEVPQRHWRPLRPPLAELLDSRRRDEAAALAYRDHGLNC